MKVPFYTLQLQESAEEEIRKLYGNKKVSQNIINMYNDHLRYIMLRGRSIYDFEVISSKWFRKEVKNPFVSKPKELARWMQVREFKNGTKFRTKKEAKHYRFSPHFLRKHGFCIGKIFVSLKKKDQEFYTSSKLEFQSNQNISKLKINLNLWTMGKADIETDLFNASQDRFDRKNIIREGKVLCIQKRYDFDLSYHLDDFNLYRNWETKIGCYRLYNSLIKFKYGKRKAKINLTNYRLDHKLLELPKECLRFIRIDGEPLVEIDLRNSQPCLLMNMLFGNLKVPFEDYQIALEKIKTDYYDLVWSFKNDSKLNELVESSYTGSIYEVLHRLSNESYSRSEVKLATMFVMFSGFKSKWNSSMKIWLDNFPKLYWFIQNLKISYFKAYRDGAFYESSQDGRLSSKSAYDASKSFLPILLQKIEATIFLDHILKNLYKQDIFALSKHDAILCKKSDEAKVKRIMEIQLTKLLGVKKYTLDSSTLCEEEYLCRA